MMLRTYQYDWMQLVWCVFSETILHLSCHNKYMDFPFFKYCPSLISLRVSVNVKHHVYLLPSSTNLDLWLQSQLLVTIIISGVTLEVSCVLTKKAQLTRVDFKEVCSSSMALWGRLLMLWILGQNSVQRECLLTFALIDRVTMLVPRTPVFMYTYYCIIISCCCFLFVFLRGLGSKEICILFIENLILYEKCWLKKSDSLIGFVDLS